MESKETITQILKLGKGHISLCGGKIVDVMCKGHSGYSDYDFFFHSCKPEEATEILFVCLHHLAVTDGHVSFTRNKGCITVEGREKYQFILRLYDNCSQILGGFDIWTSRIGYNLELGLFSTIQGAFSIATGYFPIDVTRRSTSYGTRIDKYHRDKGQGVLFPGLDLEINEALANKDPFIIKTPDGDIYISMVKSKLCVDFTCYIHNKSDYDNGESYLNWRFFIKNKPELLSISSYNVNNIVTIGNSTIKDSLSDILKPPNERSYTLEPRAIENLFNFTPFKDEHNNLCKEFKEVYYINRNMQEATNIWKIMSEWYTQKIQEVIHKNLISFLKPDGKFCGDIWKVVDPSTQVFGANNPIITNPRDWYSQEFYSSFEIGISKKHYIALKLCRLKNPHWKLLNKDLFNLICQKLMQSMANDTIRKLIVK